MCGVLFFVFFTSFFFNDTATTEIYTLSLHDALPIFETYSEASHQRDLDRYLSHWHPDFLGWHNGDNKPTNHQERAKGLAYYFKSTKSIEYKLEPLAIIVVADGKAAIVHYKLKNVLESKSSGKKSSGLSYWTDYLVKENGTWLLISDHGGSVPEAWTAKK